MIKVILVPLLIVFYAMQISAQNVNAEALVNLHSATTAEINTLANPYIGSLLFNTDNATVLVFTGSEWKSLLSSGTETRLQEGAHIDISGLGTLISPYIITSIKPTMADSGDGTFTFSNGVDLDISFNAIPE